MRLCLPKFLALRSRRGLTLFELLVVMSILAIMVSLVIGLGRYADLVAKRHQAIANLGQWQEALHQYDLQAGEYPGNQYNGSVANLLNACASNVVYFSAQFPTQINTNTIPNLTIDPWGTPYQYVAPAASASQSFDLFSCGPDRQGGTSDDIRFQP